MIPWEVINRARLVIEAVVGLGLEVYYGLPGYVDPKEGSVGIGLLGLVTAEVVLRRLFQRPFGVPPVSGTRNPPPQG